MTPFAAPRQNAVGYYSHPRPELVGLVQAAGLRVLEVGCASGAMGAALLANGAREVVGLDVCDPAVAQARLRLSAAFRVDLNTLPELPFPPGHFDLVTCADVLEHLVDPAAVLRHLRRWLSDDGRLLVSIPNVRHASVVLPLLVHGDWEYQDAGILDRTHLRFYSRTGVLRLLEEAGFALDGRLAGVSSPRPAAAERAAELVAALGGDPAKFLEECDVVQFVFFARPVDRPAPRLAPAPEPEPEGPWAGSRPVRVLVAPAAGPGDVLGAALPAIARTLSGARDVTLGITVPPGAAEPPAALAAAGAELELDVLLLEAPAAAAGWDAIVRGAALVVLTGEAPALEAAARRHGVEVRDARTDPALSQG